MAQYEALTPSTMLLRLVEPERAVQALRMLRDSLPETGPPVPDGYRVATISDVSSDSSVAPLAACVVHHHRDEPVAWINRFAVAAPLRRCGLGRRLLAELARALQAEGAQWLWAYAGDASPAAVALLTGAGFAVRPPEPDLPFTAGLAASENESGLSWWVREL